MFEDFPNTLTTVTLKCLVITVQIEMQSGHATTRTDCVHVNKYLVEQPAQNKTTISNVKSLVETILMRQRKDRRLDILVCGWLAALLCICS